MLDKIEAMRNHTQKTLDAALQMLLVAKEFILKHDIPFEDLEQVMLIVNQAQALLEEPYVSPKSNNFQPINRRVTGGKNNRRLNRTYFLKARRIVIKPKITKKAPITKTESQSENTGIDVDPHVDTTARPQSEIGSPNISMTMPSISLNTFNVLWGELQGHKEIPEAEGGQGLPCGDLQVDWQVCQADGGLLGQDNAPGLRHLEGRRDVCQDQGQLEVTLCLDG